MKKKIQILAQAGWRSTHCVVLQALFESSEFAAVKVHNKQPSSLYDTSTSEFIEPQP